MPKALRPGKETGATILIGAKAPIVQGALLSSVLVPFVPAAELLDTLKELIKRIWEFWDEYGKNRERVGELIQRVGHAELSWMASAWSRCRRWSTAPRDNPYIFFQKPKNGERRNERRQRTTTAKRITDIGPPHYEKFLPPIIKRNYGQWKYHEILAPGVLVPRRRVRRQALHGARRHRRGC